MQPRHQNPKCLAKLTRIKNHCFLKGTEGKMPPHRILPRRPNHDSCANLTFVTGPLPTPFFQVPFIQTTSQTQLCQNGLSSFYKGFRDSRSEYIALRQTFLAVSHIIPMGNVMRDPQFHSEIKSRTVCKRKRLRVDKPTN